MWIICLFKEKVQIKVECNCVYSKEKIELKRVGILC